MKFTNTDTLELGFTFVAIRKNASSSIGNAIYSLKNNMPYTHSDFPKDINHSNIFINNSEENIDSVFKFTCIRNPFERLVSGFTHKVLQHPGEEIRQYAEIVPNHKNLIGDIQVYFNSFLTFLEEYDFTKIDSHFALQYDCARFNDIEYSLVINQSNIEEDWLMVQKAIPNMPNLISHKIHVSGSENLLDTLRPFEDRVKSLYAKDYNLIESFKNIDK